MKTSQNRLATLAAMLRNGGDVIDIADELDALVLAGEGPSDAEEELQRVSELLVEHFGETTRSSVSAHLADVISQQSNAGLSVDQRLEWVGENVCEITRCREHDGVCVHWIDSDLDEHLTEAPTIDDAIRQAMSEDASREVTT